MRMKRIATHWSLDDECVEMTIDEESSLDVIESAFEASRDQLCQDRISYELGENLRFAYTERNACQNVMTAEQLAAWDAYIVELEAIDPSAYTDYETLVWPVKP